MSSEQRAPGYLLYIGDDKVPSYIPGLFHKTVISGIPITQLSQVPGFEHIRWVFSTKSSHPKISSFWDDLDPGFVPLRTPILPATSVWIVRAQALEIRKSDQALYLEDGLPVNGSVVSN